MAIIGQNKPNISPIDNFIKLGEPVVSLGAKNVQTIAIIIAVIRYADKKIFIIKIT
jgi:hypothetical protein